MDFHPVFVHFPIALLTVYGVAEVLRTRWFTGRPWWFSFKAMLIVVGVLGAVAAFATGNAAGDKFRSDHQLAPIVQAHENWAKAVLILFGIIATAYLLVF